MAQNMKNGGRSGRSTPTDGAGRSGRNTPTTTEAAHTPLTIFDLPPEEKAKIQSLAERLVALGREHEETVSNLSNERARHAAEIDAANRRIEDELDAADAKLMRQGEAIALLQEQRAAAFSLLTQYQTRLKTYDNEVRAKERAAEELRRKLVEAVEDVARLEKTVESQRAHMEGIEAASGSAKRLFEEALQASEERGRRLSEDVNNAAERIREAERRSQGLETAVGGLTKQINSMKRAAAGSSERIAELTKLVEARDLDVVKEKAAKASAVAEAEAAVAAATAATAAKMAAERVAFELPPRSRSRRSRAPLAASATSSEMLLLDTCGGEGVRVGPGAGGESGTEGEQTATSERSARRRVKSRAKSRAKSSKSGDNSVSSRQNSYSPARIHSHTSVRPHSMTVRRLPATVPAQAPVAVSNKPSRQKAEGSHGKVASASASGGARVSAALAEELGQHRRYDLSLLYLLEGM